MADPGERRLSLAEWLVLCLVLALLDRDYAVPGSQDVAARGADGLAAVRHDPAGVPARLRAACGDP
jgi:hypothetical protein